MTAFDIATLFKDYGLVGACALLVVAVLKLYADNKALSTAYLERLITGLEAAKDAAEAGERASIELRNLLEARGRAIDELNRQIGVLVEKVIHGFGNNSAAMDAFTRLLERAQAAAEQARNEVARITRERP